VSDVYMAMIRRTLEEHQRVHRPKETSTVCRCSEFSPIAHDVDWHREHETEQVYALMTKFLAHQHGALLHQIDSLNQRIIQVTNKASESVADEVFKRVTEGIEQAAEYAAQKLEAVYPKRAGHPIEHNGGETVITGLEEFVQRMKEERETEWRI